MSVNLIFVVEADEPANASRNAVELADTLREVGGVIDVVRKKATNQTMDLGAIVSVVAASGATLAIAQGVAAWLRARRGVKIIYQREKNSESLKLVVEGIDPATAARIVEEVDNQE